MEDSCLSSSPINAGPYNLTSTISYACLQMLVKIYL